MISRDVSIGTTLVFQDGMANMPGSWLSSYELPGVDNTEHRKSQIHEFRQKFFRSFIDGGGRIVLGTDFPYNQRRPPGMPIEEIQRMQKIGMTPMEIILASTIHAAETCGLRNEIGTLEIGKKADIIVVKGNPLDNLAVLEDILVVVKNGDIVVAPK